MILLPAMMYFKKISRKRKSNQIIKNTVNTRQSNLTKRPIMVKTMILIVMNRIMMSPRSNTRHTLQTTIMNKNFLTT